MKKTVLLIALFILPKLLFSQFTAESIYDYSLNYMVFIESYDENDNLISTGSGIVVTNDGLVVTNLHVIEKSDYIKIQLPNKVIEKVETIYNYNIGKDLCLFKTNYSNINSIVLGNSDNIKIGEKIFAVGSPLGYKNTISEGIISNTLKDNNDEYIQISAPISPGSSGGVIFNSKEELIGITVASDTRGQNINFAIPINFVSLLVNSVPNLTSIKEYQFINIKFVNFLTGTFSDILSKAKNENKLIMVDVMTEWCKWCIELDNKVYSKPDIYKFANANQINYKIDAEKGEGVDFAKKYKIQGYPSILFLDGDGNEVDRVYGYVPAKDFMEMMQDYNKGINTFSYLKAEVEKNPSNIEASLKLADKYSMYSENDKAKELLNKIVALDGSNAVGKTDDANFRLILFTEKEEKAKQLEAFITNNPASDQLKDAYVSLSETFFYELSDLPSSEKWFKDALSKFPNDESVNSSYGQFINQRAAGLADRKFTKEDSLKGLVNQEELVKDYQKGLSFIETALQYIAGSVNEASSYYIQSKLYFNLKDYTKANESIDKALKIFDRKLYREQKEKVEKQLSQK